MSGIRLSDEHGVNPMILQCFWCGKGKNEIALLGKLKGDKEAPMLGVMDYEPCALCKEQFAQGISFIEMSTTPKIEGMPPIQRDRGVDFYPTGTFCVIKREAVEGWDIQNKLKQSILNRGKCFVMPDDYKQLFGPLTSMEDGSKGLQGNGEQNE